VRDEQKNKAYVSEKTTNVVCEAMLFDDQEKRSATVCKVEQCLDLRTDFTFSTFCLQIFKLLRFAFKILILNCIFLQFASLPLIGLFNTDTLIIGSVVGDA
jgi:hypothetical protein